MSTKPIDVSALTQSWVHSHEEDTPTTCVYRPASFAFPPSRGRSGFNLQPGGILTARKPGPTDQTTTAAGSWKLSGEKLELCAQGQSAQTLHVASLEPDRLVVRKTSSA